MDKQTEDLRDERDEAIRDAFRDDMPMTTIAEVLGMSYQRVQQIVRS